MKMEEVIILKIDKWKRNSWKCGYYVVGEGRRVIYPLSTMEGLALAVPVAQSQLLPFPTAYSNASMIVSSSVTCFQLVIVIVIACFSRVCLSQTTPWTRVSFSDLVMFAGTGTGTGTGTRRSSSRASHSHRPRQLCEWGFHTAEISEFLCFPRSQGSSQCFSCPRWSHCSTHHRRDASIQAYLPRQGS